MTHSTLLRTAGTLALTAILLLPTLATAHERPLTPPEPRFSLAALWNVLSPLLPERWQRAAANAGTDNGWLIDPNGSPAGPSADTGWLIDPDG